MAEQTVGNKKEEADKDDDPYFCDVCNITFDVPKAYFSHVYSISHLQRSNASENQASKARSSAPDPITGIPTPVSATESELTVEEGSKAGTGAEKPPAISEHQSRAADNSGVEELMSKPTAPLLSNEPLGKPVDFGGNLSSSDTVITTSQTGSITMPQVVSGSTAVAPQAVSSVAAMSSEPTVSTAFPGSHELSKSSTSITEGVAVSSSNANESQTLNSSISVTQRSPSDVTTPSRASVTKTGPLLSTPRIPSLMSVGRGGPVPRPQGSGYDPRPAIPPSAFSQRQLLNPTLPSNQKIPLLRSPPPASPSFSPFSDPFTAPYLGTTFAPRPAPVPHHPHSLLPTPASAQNRGTLLNSPLLNSPVQPLMKSDGPASRPGFSRSWDPSGPSFSGGDDPQPHGVSVKDYHHGRPAEHKVVPSYEAEDRGISRELQFAGDVQRNVKPSQKPEIRGTNVEPLMDGSWVVTLRPFNETKGGIYRCQMCGVKFDELLMHELHLAGLRHRKMAKGLGSKGPGSGSVHAPFENSDGFDVDSHDPVFVTGLLDLNQTPSSSSAKASASASSVCYSELEQMLRNHPDPILGVDYLTEYRFLGGRLEYSCDLCDVELKSATEVADHVTSTRHRLQYLSYNDTETYKAVSEAPDVGSSAKEAAERLEKSGGRKSRVRVKLESDDLLSNGQFAWIELKDDLIRPVSALPGHRLETTYSQVKPHEATVKINSIDSLFQTLALHSCLAANRPPSLARPLRRLDFITTLRLFKSTSTQRRSRHSTDTVPEFHSEAPQATGEFNMTSDRDAEISFQLANFLTVSVIHFRRQMLSSLNSIDVSSIEKRLNTLLRNAEAVTQKLITTDPAELDITRPESV